MTMKPTNASDGTTQSKVKPGEPVHFTLGGKPYTWIVSRAWRPAAGADCGNAAWIVYRDDFLIKDK
jgi:hypothetical protein